MWRLKWISEEKNNYSKNALSNPFEDLTLFRPIKDKQAENWSLQHKVRGRTFISMGSISELEIRLCIISCSFNWFCRCGFVEPKCVASLCIVDYSMLRWSKIRVLAILLQLFTKIFVLLTAVAMLLLCYRYAIAMLLLCYCYAIAMLSLCYRYAIAMLLLLPLFRISIYRAREIRTLSSVFTTTSKDQHLSKFNKAPWLKPPKYSA